MGIISTLLERRSGVNLSLSELDRLMDAQFAPTSITGRSISPVGSLSYIPVYDCVRILAETIGSLPLHVYRRLPAGGKERDSSHSLYTLLHDQPNPELTSSEWRQCTVAHLALWGNAYSDIVRDASGRVVSLWPLRPDRMRVTRLAPGQLGYLYRLSTGEDRALRMDEVMHFRLLALDGVMGLSPISQAREAVALGLGTEEFGARWFGNGSRPGGVLQHPQKLSKEAAERLKGSWEQAHRGLDTAHRVAILEEGMTWQSIGVPPEDAQFLQTRKYQVNEIARLYRIPPHMLGDLDRATFSNIEHQSLEFTVHTISPWLVNIEQRLHADLLSEAERRVYFAEFLVAGLLRGDIKSRYEAYAVGRGNGWLSADDIRELENMNPLPDGQGKIYLVPLNMVPATQLGQEPPLDQEPPDEQIVRALPPLEDRAANRRRIAARWRSLFAETAGRIVRRERTDILALAERWLTRRDIQQFTGALEDYYRRHGEFVDRAMLPVLLTFADEIAADAAAEVNAEAGMTPELEQFMRGYAANLSRDWTGSSQGQLRQVATAAEQSGQEPMDAIQTRLDEWVETRPDKVAEQHTVEAAGAVTVFTWRRAGIRRLRWVTHGSKDCPYCHALSGKVVGIEETFVGMDDGVTVDGQTALRPSRHIKHPPLHGKCNCGLAPA